MPVVTLRQRKVLVALAGHSWDTIRVVLANKNKKREAFMARSKCISEKVLRLKH